MENERQKYGGQAVVEGVMMRSPRYFAVACRRETDQKIVLRVENVESALKGLKWLNKPFLRGSLALVDSMMMGYKALAYSAGVQLEAEAEKQSDDGSVPTPHKPLNKEEQELKAAASSPINNIAIGGAAVFALVVGYGIFWVLPTLVTQAYQNHRHWVHPNSTQSIELNLSDGLIRIVLFLAYILLISLMKHVQRVFQYHGAEHKAINALEAGRDLTIQSARESSRIHPRCGTNFLFLVLIVTILVMAPFGRPPVLERMALLIVTIPIVAGISYEILKFAGSHRNNKLAQLLVAPGLALQYLTTRVPNDDQIEVALQSLRAVWNKEHDIPETVEEQQTEEPAAAVA